jgi:hypothetical protein
VTEREADVLELAIKLRQAKYVVEEALIRMEYNHAVDMLIKERRDEKPNKNEVPPQAGDK